MAYYHVKSWDGPRIALYKFLIYRKQLYTFILFIIEKTVLPLEKNVGPILSAAMHLIMHLYVKMEKVAKCCFNGNSMDDSLTSRIKSDLAISS